MQWTITMSALSLQMHIRLKSCIISKSIKQSSQMFGNMLKIPAHDEVRFLKKSSITLLK